MRIDLIAPVLDLRWHVGDETTRYPRNDRMAGGVEFSPIIEPSTRNRFRCARKPAIPDLVPCLFGCQKCTIEARRVLEQFSPLLQRGSRTPVDDKGEDAAFDHVLVLTVL